MNKRLRAVVVLRSDGLCEICLRARDLEPHHLFGRAKVPESESNVIMLCGGLDGCHRRFHDAKPSARVWWERFTAWASLTGYKATAAACLERVQRLEAKGF